MNILGIDTSTKHMSIALIADDLILGELIFNSNMDHSEKLISNISYILESNSLKMKDIDLIGVAKGPGSFTGIRIGIATVKGLCEFSDIPVVGVSSLEVLSRNFSHKERVAVAVDAKRDRVYGAIYDYGLNEVLVPEGLYELGDFIELIRENNVEVLAGDINQTFLEVFGDSLIYSEGLTGLNHAANVCYIARREHDLNKSISHMDLNANYMTKSQAQMDMEKKNGNL